MIYINEEYSLCDMQTYIEKNVKLLLIGPITDERTKSVYETFKNKIKCVQITYTPDNSMIIEVLGETPRAFFKCPPLELGQKLLYVFERFRLEYRSILMDITSLQPVTIMQILRCFIKETRCKPAKLFTAYAKPAKYIQERVERKYIFSEKFKSASSIDGFTARAKENEIFIPFLGFEGARLKSIIGDMQFRQIKPVIGFPSDDPYWQFETMKSCMDVLKEQSAETYIEKCKANSIYDAITLLQKITNPNDNYVIAPLGTKPHTVAAAIYVLQHSEKCRLIYDYAVEKTGITDGVQNITITHISHFL